ncbi:MAG: hypothetical protein FWC10_03685, partial [Lentimicrobiaceae bacterium]|nr:hypothetical protein [Lentimicrobiaceae bacterium]
MKIENLKFGKYSTSNSRSARWAEVGEIKQTATLIDVEKEDNVGGGIPLIVENDGKQIYVDSSDTNTMVFGASGSKKTRMLCVPLIYNLILSSENMIISDPKGELHQK